MPNLQVLIFFYIVLLCFWAISFIVAPVWVLRTSKKYNTKLEQEVTECVHFFTWIFLITGGCFGFLCLAAVFSLYW